MPEERKKMSARLLWILISAVILSQFYTGLEEFGIEVGKGLTPLVVTWTVGKDIADHLGLEFRLRQLEEAVSRMKDKK